MKQIHLKENIYLRELAESDSYNIFRTIDSQREYLGLWLPFVSYTKSLSDSVAFVQTVLSIPEERCEPVFVIIADERFAGLIGFRDTDIDNRKTEIGYWLRQEYQGKGIMTTAVDKLCRHAFNELDINRIRISCAVGNTASGNIPRRLGFTFEGIERNGELQSDGKFSDLEVFSLLAKEYKQ